METQKVTILTADEAYKITKSNRASFEECMRIINDQAKFGNSFAIIIKEIDVDATDKLMDMGYNFGTVIDSFGVKNIKISWKQ